MNPILKHIAHSVFHRSGALQAWRWKTRRLLRVIMYHRFPDPQALAHQCELLTRNYTVLPLAESTRRLAAGDPLPDYAASVTVDDGYRDFYTNAQPVFARYGIHPTVYLITGFLDGEDWVWGDRIVYAFLRTKLGQFTLELPAASPQSYILAAHPQRLHAARSVKESLKYLDNDDRRDAVHRICEELVCFPEVPPDEFAPLTWDQVRELHRAGVEFGGHTHTHPILSRVAGIADLNHEVGICKERIEQELQNDVLHFCYPNGREIDIGAAAVNAVRSHGYRTAVTTSPRCVHPADDLFRLPRIGVDVTLPDRYFEQLLVGVSA